MNNRRLNAQHNKLIVLPNVHSNITMDSEISLVQVVDNLVHQCLKNAVKVPAATT
jgi:hypothetical protein